MATPGRVIDLMKRKILRTDYMRTFILDEADEMLSGGFQESVKEIFKYLPGDVQIGLFSATLPP